MASPLLAPEYPSKETNLRGKNHGTQPMTTLRPQLLVTGHKYITRFKESQTNKALVRITLCLKKNLLSC